MKDRLWNSYLFCCICKTDSAEQAAMHCTGECKNDNVPEPEPKTLMERMESAEERLDRIERELFWHPKI